MNRVHGQHFLTDPAILEQIRDEAHLEETDRVLEIGTGPGTLTHFLCDRAGEVLSVEIDSGLHAFSSRELEGYGNLELLCLDALESKSRLSRVLRERLEAWDSFKVVANLPYNVATPLLIELFRRLERLERAVVLVQRELAERITSPPGQKIYGPPGILLGYWAHGKIRGHVPPGSFVPPPRVHSSVLVLERRGRPEGPRELYDAFSAWVRLLMAARRKQLGGLLRRILGPDRGREALELTGRIQFPDPVGGGGSPPPELDSVSRLRPEVLVPRVFIELAARFGAPEG